MSKKQKIIGISIFSIIGILLCLNIAFPMYVYNGRYCIGNTGPNGVSPYFEVYSIGFVRSNYGNRFISPSDYKDVIKYINELKGKLKEIKSNDLVCPQGLYGTPSYIKIGGKYYEIVDWDEDPDAANIIYMLDGICRGV